LTFLYLKAADVQRLERRKAGGGLLREEVGMMEGSEVSEGVTILLLGSYATGNDSGFL